jgi:hypothetical protein
MNFKGERHKTMTQEVDKLLVASFIRELMYHIWLASIMMVKKSNDKW